MCNNPKVPNQTNQFQIQIMIERCNPLFGSGRTWQPVVGTNPRIESSGRKTSRSQEIETRSFHEEAVKHDRTRQPVVCCHINDVPDFSQTRSSYESTRFNVGDEAIHDRTGQPVVNRDESGHEQAMLNEVNMDFRILGLPHSVVKHAENYRVRELVKKIENHPHRQSLQLDLRQDKAHNPFSATAKKMIKDVGNVELFELFETDPKTQCKGMLIVLESRHRLLHMRASLERNSGQPQFHCIYIGPSFNSRIRNKEGKTSWPQIWESSRKQRILSGP